MHRRDAAALAWAPGQARQSSEARAGTCRRRDFGGRERRRLHRSIEPRVRTRRPRRYRRRRTQPRACACACCSPSWGPLLALSLSGSSWDSASAPAHTWLLSMQPDTAHTAVFARPAFGVTCEFLRISRYRVQPEPTLSWHQPVVPAERQLGLYPIPKNSQVALDAYAVAANCSWRWLQLAKSQLGLHRYSGNFGGAHLCGRLCRCLGRRLPRRIFCWITRRVSRLRRLGA